MSLEEIKNNYEYLNNRYNLQEIILSGGEPTLHPNFWKILDFFCNQKASDYFDYISINTNGILLSDRLFENKMSSFIKNSKRRISFAISFSSINNWPAKTEHEKKKLEGIKNGILFRFNSKSLLSIIITLTRQNYKILPELIDFISNTYNEVFNETKSNIQKPIIVEIRNGYLEHYTDEKQKQKFVIEDFNKELQYIEKSLEKILKNPFIITRLFNLPYCYFKKDLAIKILQSTRVSTNETRFHIDKKQQMTKIIKECFHKETFKNKECQNCILFNICNKIQPEYLKYNYPKLKAF